MNGSFVMISDDELAATLRSWPTLLMVLLSTFVAIVSGMYVFLNRLELWIRIALLLFSNFIYLFTIFGFASIWCRITTAALRTMWISMVFAAIMMPYSDFVLWLSGAKYESIYWRIAFFAWITMQSEVSLWLYVHLFLNVVPTRSGLQAKPTEPAPPIQLGQPTGQPSTAPRRSFVTLGTLTVEVDSLVRLSAQGNYVEVSTLAGRHLVLLPFHEAIALLPPEAGIRVHRSHWVSQTAVHEIDRQGREMNLVLTDGTKVPVSRSRQTEILHLI